MKRTLRPERRWTYLSAVIWMELWPHLVAHVKQWRPGFDQQRAEGVAQVMKAEASEIRLLQRREEVAFAQCADADWSCSVLSGKYQFVRNRAASILPSLEETVIAHTEENLAQFPRHIDSSRAVSLGSAEFPAITATLNEDVAIRIFWTLAKLKISPPQTENLSLAKSGSQSD
jgi:hypothetical protein